jgi:ribosome-associated protein
LIEAYPNLDSAQLRLLVRNALREREANLPPKSFRQLFQLLSSTIPDDTR